MPYHLHYEQFGDGENILLAFHGFGQDHTVFKTLASPSYTIYSFDLFFHGQSLCESNTLDLSPQQWGELIADFLHRHQLEKFSLIGFSLGARVALMTYSLFAQRVKNLWLVAPDGIRPNYWYYLATHFPFRYFFKWLAHEPTNWVAILLKIGRYLKLLPLSMAILVAKQWHTRLLRLRVYRTWLIYRHLNTSRTLIKKLVREHQTQTIFILSSKDTLIPFETIKKFAYQLPNAQLIQLDCGHHKLLEKIKLE